MNIVQRLNKNEYTENDLLSCLDSQNPIVIFAAMSCIVKNNIVNNSILSKLKNISINLDPQCKMVGYYKVGHVAMSVLLKLGVNEKNVFYDGLDDFDRKMVWEFYNSTWKN